MTQQFTQSCLPKWIENPCSYKSLYINVCSFIHNCPKQETNKMSLKRWMNEYNLVFPAAWFSIMNVLICRHEHWHLHKRCVSCYTFIINDQIGPKFLYTSPPRWSVWVYPRAMDPLSLCCQQRWGTVLRHGCHHQREFHFLQSLDLWQIPNSMCALAVPIKDC